MNRDVMNMGVAINLMLEKAKEIQGEKPIYATGGDGYNCKCDCIGLIIGSIRRAGGKWTGLHGSNYAARSEMVALEPITSTSILEPGMAVYKSKSPGEAGYNLPEKYKQGGSSYNGDLMDYYHVGIVVSASPLQIMHCTSGNGVNGITVDTKLGSWKHGGRLKKGDYDGKVEVIQVVGYATVVTSGGILNIRTTPAPKGTDLGDIPNGALVEVLKKTNSSWWRVSYNGLVGYCASEYLKEVQSNTATDEVAVVMSKDAWLEVKAAIIKAGL